MSRLTHLTAGIALTVLGSVGIAWSAPARLGIETAVRPPAAGANATLNVLTYNVHGLPWPIVEPRGDELGAIAHRLAHLHRRGSAPQVAVIQEAFTNEARSIAKASGYRYVAYGPGEQGPFALLPSADPSTALVRYGSWLKGEGLGKWEGSGLMLLSDFPIVRVRRISYSREACAGYDCLAAKGAILAELVFPSGDVEVATTHLNSRRASGVSDGRSNDAWIAQARELEHFVATQRNPNLPLILAGDFNVGRDPLRSRGIAKLMHALGPRTTDALRSLRHVGLALNADENTELRRAKDWELEVDGASSRLQPLSASMTFGSAGGALSDHLGYSVTYALQEARLPRARL